jgi:hypothetical protein
MGKTLEFIFLDAKDLAQSLFTAFFQSVGGGTLTATK